jgi:hypothetical protein
MVARAVDVAADSATIALLPTLVTVLGGTAGAGLAAAALYAVFPKADDPIDVRLDEQPAIVHGVARGPVTVGRFPRVTLSTPFSTKVREIIIRPAPGGSSHP